MGIKNTWAVVRPQQRKVHPFPLLVLLPFPFLSRGSTIQRSSRQLIEEETRPLLRLLFGSGRYQRQILLCFLSTCCTWAVLCWHYNLLHSLRKHGEPFNDLGGRGKQEENSWAGWGQSGRCPQNVLSCNEDKSKFPGLGHTCVQMWVPSQSQTDRIWGMNFPSGWVTSVNESSSLTLVTL